MFSTQELPKIFLNSKLLNFGQFISGIKIYIVSRSEFRVLGTPCINQNLHNNAIMILLIYLLGWDTWQSILNKLDCVKGQALSLNFKLSKQDRDKDEKCFRIPMKIKLVSGNKNFFLYFVFKINKTSLSRKLRKFSRKFKKHFRNYLFGKLKSLLIFLPKYPKIFHYLQILKIYETKCLPKKSFFGTFMQKILI